jgi:hypothetical protein
MAAFVPFSIISLYANYKSSHAVELRGLNLQRAELLMAAHINGRVANTQSSTKSRVLSGRDGRPYAIPDEPLVLSPADVAPMEVFVGRHKSPFASELFLEPLLRDIVGESCDQERLASLLGNRAFVAEENYMLAVVPSSGGGVGEVPAVALWFRDDSNPRDQFAGLLHACHARWLLERDAAKADGDVIGATASVVSEAHASARADMPAVWAKVERHGWIRDTMMFASGGAAIS